MIALLKKDSSNSMEIEVRKDDESKEKDLDKDDSRDLKNMQGIHLSLYYTKFDDKSLRQALEDACSMWQVRLRVYKRKIAKIDSEIFKLQNKGKDNRTE